MKLKTYVCPFGGSLIRASTQESLKQKVAAHWIYAHGVYALVACQP